MRRTERRATIEDPQHFVDCLAELCDDARINVLGEAVTGPKRRARDDGAAAKRRARSIAQVGRDSPERGKSLTCHGDDDPIECGLEQQRRA